jgi:uncharacterized membrane protein (DUF441 family)
MFDPTLLILLALAALGFISHNTTVAISILVLIIVRVTPLNTFFPWIEKQGLTIGIIILTIGVMAPIASGTLPASTLLHSFVNWKSLVAIAVGIFVVAGRARRYADEQPALAGGGSAGGHRAGRGALSRRAGRPADCGRPCLAVYWEVVVRLAI